jgi:serine/threonine protein kinase
MPAPPTTMSTPFNHSSRCRCRRRYLRCYCHCSCCCSVLCLARQLFFGCSCYTSAPDIWAFGCTLGAVLLAGDSLIAPLAEQQLEGHVLAGTGGGGGGRGGGGGGPLGGAAQLHGQQAINDGGELGRQGLIGEVERQLLAIFDLLGTPSWAEICAMNPELQGAHGRMREWMATPPRPACLSWREQIMCANSRANEKLSRGACTLLALILQYTPHARPSAAALCEHEFFAMRG